MLAGWLAGISLRRIIGLLSQAGLRGGLECQDARVELYLYLGLSTISYGWIAYKYAYFR